jgi:hypothetical protein
MYAPDFCRKLGKTRKTLLGEIAKNLKEKLNDKNFEKLKSKETENKPEENNLSGTGFGISLDPMLKKNVSNNNSDTPTHQVNKLGWIESLSNKDW